MKALKPLPGSAWMRFSSFSNSMLMAVVRQDAYHVRGKYMQALGDAYRTRVLRLLTDFAVGPLAGRSGSMVGTLPNLGGHLWT